jgi:hypothetical protein
MTAKRPSAALPAALAAALLLSGLLLAGCRRSAWPTFLGGGAPEAKAAVCEGRYALCAAAACTPVPVFDARTGKVVLTKALCDCEVANGPSLGTLPCSARAPQGEGRFLVAAFSFGDTAVHPTLSCAAGTPWASCADAPCTVDPKDPGKAHCTCRYQTEGEYQTLGGGCDKSKCGSLLAAATPEAMKEAGKLLAEEEGLKAVPANSCP